MSHRIPCLSLVLLALVLSPARPGHAEDGLTDRKERKPVVHALLKQTNLWQARHDAYYAALALAPGKKGIATDACVPISRLAEAILDTKKDIEESGLVAPIVGHVGDGNFHLVLLYDEADTEELGRCKALIERMNHRAIAMGGTCTGEHGIGMGKKHFLVAEHGDAVSYMRQVKKAFDPENIMNPGKMVSL